MVTNHVRKLIENYLTLTIWFMVYEDDKDISSEQFTLVLGEIGRVEDELRRHGVAQSTIDKLLDYGRDLYKTPIDQLPENIQLRMCKIIFGAGTKWSDTPPTPKQSLEKGESDAETM